MSARWWWKVGPSQTLGLRGARDSFRPEADVRQKVGRWGPTVFEDRLLTGRSSSVAWGLPDWKMKRFEARVGVPQRGLGAAGYKGRKPRVPKCIEASL